MSQRGRFLRSRFRVGLFFFLVALAGTAGGIYAYLSPGLEMLEPPAGYRLVWGAQDLDDPVFVRDDEVLLPVETVRTYLDPDLSWEPQEGRLTITTRDRLLQMNTDQLTAYLNRQEIELQIPPTTIEGAPTMPLLFLQDLYGIKVQVHHDTRLVTIDQRSLPYMEAAAQKRVHLRTRPSLRAPRVAVLEESENARVFRDDGGWYHLRTEGGQLGYAPKLFLRLTGVYYFDDPARAPPREVPWKPMGERISLVWEYVQQESPSPEELEAMPGVNVVSPTWFSLRDEQGNLDNRASAAYVSWAHEQGYQVWALVSNSFDRDLSAAVLGDSRKRRRVIEQLLVFAELYDLDGINVDFENMYLQDRDNFTQFMREFAPLAREQGLVLSVDVTVKSSSEHWSMIYDRQNLAETVDYVILMAYDEHWAASPVAGSVASLPWVERGLQGVLEEVPAKKLLLGVPFYARLWEIELLEDGSEEVSSRAFGMDRLQRILEEHGAETVFCPQTGQNFASYTEQGKEYRAWIEDLESLSRRWQLIERYNLAGVAAWRRGFENEAVWELFEERIRP